MNQDKSRTETGHESPDLNRIVNEEHFPSFEEVSRVANASGSSLPIPMVDSDVVARRRRIRALAERLFEKAVMKYEDEGSFDESLADFALIARNTFSAAEVFERIADENMAKAKGATQ